MNSSGWLLQLYRYACAPGWFLDFCVSVHPVSRYDILPTSCRGSVMLCDSLRFLNLRLRSGFVKNLQEHTSTGKYLNKRTSSTPESRSQPIRKESGRRPERMECMPRPLLACLLPCFLACVLVVSVFTFSLRLRSGSTVWLFVWSAQAL